ncbi:hypothetical protein [Sphingosinicella humi]|uniref:Uncharacterized protein n=1 Tax=Allosphingosinicella humi TaxID=2068657 RepID=A0A2U2J3U9_9SPHN|nr:hypothetical protein [Sphingosinicella humi]PWG02951.1 hypothetical protein DF286_08775 [Sphingosinicella humi]
MNRAKLVAALSAAVLLIACEARIGKDDGETAKSGEGNASVASAEGKSETGQFSIDAPGFDLKFRIPEGMTDRAKIDSDSDVLYPGARLTGMHIQAEEGSGRDSVELRFASSDAPQTVAAWYQDPGRADKLKVAAVRQEGGSLIVEGSETDDGDPFTVHLSAGTGGGTDGRLVLSDRD